MVRVTVMVTGIVTVIVKGSVTVAVRLRNIHIQRHLSGLGLAGAELGGELGLELRQGLGFGFGL